MIDHTKDKDELRKIIKKDVDRFLADGGKIKFIKDGAVTEGSHLPEQWFESRNEKVRLRRLRSDSKENREHLIKLLAYKYKL